MHLGFTLKAAPARAADGLDWEGRGDEDTEEGQTTRRFLDYKNGMEMVPFPGIEKR